MHLRTTTEPPKDFPVAKNFRLRSEEVRGASVDGSQSASPVPPSGPWRALTQAVKLRRSSRISELSGQVQNALPLEQKILPVARLLGKSILGFSFGKAPRGENSLALTKGEMR